MIISVINHTSGLLADADVQRAVEAINCQMTRDFFPLWDRHATLRLEAQAPASVGVGVRNATDSRPDAVIYMWHPINIRWALGYHALNFLGVPYGFVFPGISRTLGEPWTATLSHEALELVVDPEVNLLVMGPDPRNPPNTVFHWYEVCDAVQGERYLVEDVPVSNFVLPLYFTNSEELGSRNDFLGRRYGGRRLRSFGVNPGCYVGFFNPLVGRHETFFAEGDRAAVERYRIKAGLGLARRAQRYQALTGLHQPVTASIRRYLGMTRGTT